MTRPISVPVHLPQPALPLANWADCYQIELVGAAKSASEIAHLTLDTFPAWVSLLMRLRNRAVALFGLKAADDRPDSQNTEVIGIFPVVSRSQDEIVLGFDDRHLDFRIVIHVENVGPTRQRISTTTLVNRKILLGRIYIAVVTPFHKLIVSTMMSGLARGQAVT